MHFSRLSIHFQINTHTTTILPKFNQMLFERCSNSTNIDNAAAPAQVDAVQLCQRSKGADIADDAAFAQVKGPQLCQSVMMLDQRRSRLCSCVNTERALISVIL
jgi:hypothetical protein